MANYQIISTGNPILPTNLEIKFPISASVTYTYPVNSNKTGQELIDFMNDYGRNEENAIKTQTNFSIQDESRNSTTSFEDLGEWGAEGYHSFTVTINFNIIDAEILEYSQVNTDLIGEERDAFVADYANTIETNFKNSNPQWTCSQ